MDAKDNELNPDLRDPSTRYCREKIHTHEKLPLGREDGEVRYLIHTRFSPNTSEGFGRGFYRRTALASTTRIDKRKRVTDLTRVPKEDKAQWKAPAPKKKNKKKKMEKKTPKTTNCPWSRQATPLNLDDTQKFPPSVPYLNSVRMPNHQCYDQK